MIEIRWEARAGQGAKTASQLLAMAVLASGRRAQSFPEYGPERRGAPMRAFTRLDDRPIRRHNAVEHPQVVVVLDASLLHSPKTWSGLGREGTLLVNSEVSSEQLSREFGLTMRVRSLPASRLGAEAGSSSSNMVMLGALAAGLAEPDLEQLQQAAAQVLGPKLGPTGRVGLSRAIADGYHLLSQEATPWAS